MRHTITKNKPVNQFEEDQQLALAGDVHRDLNNREANDMRMEALGEFKSRWTERVGKVDARQDDLLLGIRLQRLAPKESHSERWIRQQEVYGKIDENASKLKRCALGTKEYAELNKERLELEAQL